MGLSSHTHTSHSLLPKSCKIVQEKHEIRKIELLQNESSKVKTNFHCVIAPRENQHFEYKTKFFFSNHHYLSLDVINGHFL